MRFSDPYLKANNGCGAAAHTVSPGTGSSCRVRGLALEELMDGMRYCVWNSPDEGVWLPLSSMASTSHL